MDAAGVWKLSDVQAVSPPAGAPFQQTFLCHGAHSSTNLVRVLEPGGIRPHVHRDHDEVIYVLEGGGDFRVGDRKVRIVPGDVIVAPKGTPHGPAGDNTGLVLLSVYAPVFDAEHPDREFIED